jgi:hypothetical protein
MQSRRSGPLHCCALHEGGTHRWFSLCSMRVRRWITRMGPLRHLWRLPWQVRLLRAIVLRSLAHCNHHDRRHRCRSVVSRRTACVVFSAAFTLCIPPYAVSPKLPLLSPLLRPRPRPLPWTIAFAVATHLLKYMYDRHSCYTPSPRCTAPHHTTRARVRVPAVDRPRGSCRRSTRRHGVDCADVRSSQRLHKRC